MNVKNISFLFLQTIEIRFRVPFFFVFATTVSVPNESNEDSHFPVTMCDNALMKPYSFVNKIVNEPVYLVLEITSLSIVQFVIVIFLSYCLHKIRACLCCCQ